MRLTPPLIPPIRGGILIAVSAGADSTALALLLAAAAEADANMGPLHLAHVEHGFRPAAAEQESAAVARLSERLGLPLHRLAAAPPATWKSGAKIPEASARAERYRLLAARAQQLGLPLVATGHHREDQVETRLLQLRRGGGLRALAGMPVLRPLAAGVALWRPLLEVSKQELLLLVARKGFTSCEDASNRDLRLARNRMRHLLLPELAHGDDPWLRVNERLGTLAGRALHRIERAAAGLLATARPSILERAFVLAWKRVANLSPALLHHVVEHFARVLAPSSASARPLSARESRELARWLLEPGASGRRAALGLLFERSDRWLLVAATPPATQVDVQTLDRDDTDAAAGVRWRAWVEERTSSPTSPTLLTSPSPCSALLPAIGELRVRGRRPGDRIAAGLSQPAPRPLKRSFLNAGVPPLERAVWPVVTLDGLPIWVPGITTPPAPRNGEPATRRVVVSGLPTEGIPFD